MVYDMSEKERAEFEAWCENRYVLLKKNTAGEYIPHITQLVYSSWQGSAERYQSRIAKLEAEVARLKDILELATNGLEWFFNAYPSGVSEADHEMVAEIDEAMKGGA